MKNYWMIFDIESGNAIDMVEDEEIAIQWMQEENVAVLLFQDDFEHHIEFVEDEEGVYSNMKEDTMAEKKKKEQKVVEMEPGDDVEEAQPSIEREDAATGRTGGSGTGGPNSAPAGSGVESGSPV